MLNGLLQAARLSAPDTVAGLLADQGEALGAQSVTIYLVDYEQVALVPLQREAVQVREPLPVASTPAGRCCGECR
jgi:hypothetical protein